MSDQTPALLDLIKKQGEQIDAFTKMIAKLADHFLALEARLAKLEQQMKDLIEKE